MKVLLFLTVLTLLLVTGLAKEKNSEPTEKRSKRVSNYHDPSYGPTSDNSYGSPGSNCNDLYSPVQCKATNVCRPPESIPVVDTTWVSVPRQYYVTMGSCFAEKLFASVLLNREPRTNQEMNEMCLTLFLKNGSTFFGGYDLQFSQNCVVPDNGKGLKCNFAPENSDSTVDMTIYPTETCYLIDCDNSTYALYYRCINNRYEDVLLLTTRPYVERPVMARVVNVMSKMGLLVDQIRPFQCSPPTYPSPFQNYLQNSCPSYQVSSPKSYSIASQPQPNPYPPTYDEVVPPPVPHHNYNNNPSQYLHPGPSPYY